MPLAVTLTPEAPLLRRGRSRLPPTNRQANWRRRQAPGAGAPPFPGESTSAMSGVTNLDHVNIASGNLARTLEFLTSVLGLENGPRPPFRSHGYWLYKNGSAVVHLSDATDKERTHVADPSHADTSRTDGKGVVDHVAFRCSGYAATIRKLRELGVAIHEAEVPGAGLHQVFIDGPDNVSFELIFTAADVAAGG
jgi:catechol 2,3-dioxygenase-like lactoylglutathione lyase family enzyme